MNSKQESPPLSITVQVEKLAFGDALLFNDIVFELPAGQWTCLLGPSGVGKTTLLKLIAGLVPEATKIKTTCSDQAPISNRVSYLAQQDLLMPWLTTIENVMLGNRLRGEPLEIEQAQHFLEIVGLAENAHDLPIKLSGGMRHRVALARTLFENKPIVLMDEPFSTLDAISRIRLQDMAAELLDNRTVLLVTHDPLEALRLGHRIHVLSGRPVALNTPLEPKSPTPRDLHDPDVLKGQADLLTKLSGAVLEGIS